jgi:hypothetical protein
MVTMMMMMMMNLTDNYNFDNKKVNAVDSIIGDAEI